MMGVSRRAGDWLAAVALVGAALALALALALAACAAGMPASAPGKGPDGRAIHATPAPRYYPHVYLPYPQSLLFTIYSADVVAHVKLKSVRDEVQHIEESPDYWRVVIWYEFEALEYLKGSGSGRIWGLAVGAGQTQSEEAAHELAARYIQHIDPLHTGEAVVFLNESSQRLPSTQEKDHYYLGGFGHDWLSDSEALNPFESYSVAGSRRWLPLAASDGVSGAGEEAQFMLRHPDGSLAGYYPEDRSYAPEEVLNADGSPVISVIGLSDLRRIAKNELGLGEIRDHYSSLAERRVGMAARNLTAEVRGDAIILRWIVNASPSALDGVKGYRAFRQASVEGNPDFPAQRLESELVKLADVSPSSSNMSYEDRAGVSPGMTYIYRVWTLEEDVYVFGEYGAEARVAVAAVDGAKAAGEVDPVPVYYWIFGRYSGGDGGAFGRG